MPVQCEFVIDRIGIKFDGVLIPHPRQQVLLAQLLYERKNTVVSVTAILARMKISGNTMGVYVSYLRPIFREYGMDIEGTYNTGYKLVSK